MQRGLAPITLQPVTDFDRLAQPAEADRIERLEVSLPTDIARRVYGSRQSSVGEFFRSQSSRGNGTISIEVAVERGGADGDLRDELRFLVEDDDVYSAVSSAEEAKVQATYYAQDGGRPRSQSFLGQVLAMTVQVEIAEPERGPQNHVASEALTRAFNSKRDALLRVLGQR